MGGMYRVELYAQVRRSVFVEGLSERQAAKRFGLARGPPVGPARETVAHIAQSIVLLHAAGAC